MKCICQSYELQTIRTYNKALAEIARRNSSKGVKLNWVFNNLPNFHVCAPELPPCLAHDLFEGVISYDLKLILDKLFKEKWFTLQELNASIQSFGYSKEEKADKTCPVSDDAAKISGGAWQIWTFLRLLPILIEDKVQDIENEAWHLILLITEIVEIVCLSEIPTFQLPYLERIICEYLLTRQTLFSESLRPKRHYLRHYSQLILVILEFGPLMKVCTMRFESRHTFFKRDIRFLHNFINVPESLAEKHELFQSLLRLGADLRFDAEVFEATNFKIHMYDEKIQSAVRKANFPNNVQECSRVIVKGTEYKKGNALVLRQSGYQYDTVIGKICMFLCDDEQDIYAIFEIVQSVFWPYLRAYELGKIKSYECLPLQYVVSYKPMHEYNVGTMLCIKPHHGFLAKSSTLD
ncbi:uncharacterized protein LOC117171138 [Belonocnema kinseyi]|uniref:uncharacterized protein LOC117171138 n=1 Tax=Belonocnema kinseyi TaxID=2817044 RepID=UPI00143DF097|nr:uncharacterized protein LOC117171138 [Belonocnema kinseyi]